MYHNFFIHSSADGHLGCFHVLAIVTSVALNNGIHVSFSILVCSGYMPRSGINGSYADFIPSFLRNIHTVILEKEMATHSSILAWRIPWTEEPSRLQSRGVTKSQTRLSNFTFTFHFHTVFISLFLMYFTLYNRL